MINPIILRSIAKTGPQIKKAMQVLSAAPNASVSFSVGQAKVLSRVLPEGSKYKPLLQTFAEIGEKLAGKKATLTVAKEASKQTKGAAVVRASISRGSQPVMKAAAKINPAGEFPSLKVGLSMPGVQGYGGSNVSLLGPEVLDDLALSVSKKGDVVKYAVKLGEAGQGGAKINPKEYTGFIDKAAGMDLASKTYQGFLDKAAAAIKEIKAAYLGKAPAFPPKSLKPLDAKAAAKAFEGLFKDGKMPKDFSKITKNITKNSAPLPKSVTDFVKKGAPKK